VRVDPSNVDQLGYWDGASGAYWARRATRFDEGVAAYRADFVAAMGLAPDEDVLDVGCGSGETTRDAAARARSALGVDLSGPMLEVARARSAGLANVRFEQADAQIHRFEPVDVIVSRTGVMFFGDPAAAFANLVAALRPGGRLVLMTWQAPERNAWQLALRRAISGGDEPPPPGLFNDPDRFGTLLRDAGCRDVTFTPHEAPMYFGPDPADAAAFLAAQHNMTPEAADVLRADMQDRAGEDGVHYDSAAWFVTAESGR
jgi:SAM-dependent methyltransferase